MKKIFIFTMVGCPYCKNLKEKLIELGIKFTDIDIDSNTKLWDQVVEQTNQSVLPMVFITEDDSPQGQILIPGTDYQEEHEIIDIIKKEMKRE